jgi:hypothetical protein
MERIDPIKRRDGIEPVHFKALTKFERERQREERERRRRANRGATGPAPTADPSPPRGEEPPRLDVRA